PYCLRYLGMPGPRGRVRGTPMAAPFDTLLQVQLHDSTLDQLRHRRTALPEHQELAVAEGRRAALVAQGAVIRSQVEDLAARQRALEAQIEAAATRRHEI